MIGCYVGISSSYRQWWQYTRIQSSSAVTTMHRSHDLRREWLHLGQVVRLPDAGGVMPANIKAVVSIMDYFP